MGKIIRHPKNKIEAEHFAAEAKRRGYVGPSEGQMEEQLLDRVLKFISYVVLALSIIFVVIFLKFAFAKAAEVEMFFPVCSQCTTVEACSQPQGGPESCVTADQPGYHRFMNIPDGVDYEFRYKNNHPVDGEIGPWRTVAIPQKKTVTGTTLVVHQSCEIAS
jgi:hypothetical protein